MKQLISVVIPSYNYSRFVCQAVDSALAQTYSPTEVIVVDDGSTDDTRERLRPYGDRIRYIYQENRHLSAARNTGIKASHGDYIAFLDADDAWHPRKLERQWLLSQQLPDVRLISTDVRVIQENEPSEQPRLIGIPKAREISLRELVFGVFFSGGSGAIVHRDCLTKVGLFDESLRSVEDYDLWLRIAAEFKLARILEPLTFIRLHPSSMSRNTRVMETNSLAVINKNFSALPQLRGKFHWKRVAVAGAYRASAAAYSCEQNEYLALLSLCRSVLSWPITCGGTAPFVRLRMGFALLRNSVARLLG
jgi:glycosyltransferase involved in cell wall biosynthesis